jgi:hypothetical protein
MNRQGFIIGLMVAVLGSVFAASAQESSPVADEANAAIAAAEQAVEQARAKIEQGKVVLATIPEDSPMMTDVTRVVKAASENWKVAVESLEGAKKSATRIQASSNPSVSQDFALLAKVNAGVAVSGAKVVEIAIDYVEAVGANQTEAITVIDTALQDALAASSQVQFNYDRVKALITKKYSK